MLERLSQELRTAKHWPPGQIGVLAEREPGKEHTSGGAGVVSKDSPVC